MTTHKRALFTLLLASLSPYEASTFTFAKTNSATASAFTHIPNPESSTATSSTSTLEAAASCSNEESEGAAGVSSSSTTQLCAAASTSMEDDTMTTTTVSEENLSLLSERGRSAIQQLVNLGDESQAHVYGGWPDVGMEDENKLKLSEQVREIFVLCVCLCVGS